MSLTMENSGRLVYKDPEVNLFLSQEKSKIDVFKKQVLQIFNADLQGLSPEKLADDTEVAKVWSDFQKNRSSELFSQWFRQTFEEKRFENALTGPLLEIFQHCVTEARKK